MQVVPPTQVAPSRITASDEPGTLAPVPPVVVPHIVVSLAVMVQAVLHVRKRFAASASKQNSKNRMAASQRMSFVPEGDRHGGSGSVRGIVRGIPRRYAIRNSSGEWQSERKRDVKAAH